MEEEEEEKQPRQTVCSAVWAERKVRERRRVGEIEGRDAASSVCFGLFFFFNSAFSRPEDVMTSGLCTP